MYSTDTAHPGSTGAHSSVDSKAQRVDESTLHTGTPRVDTLHSALHVQAVPPTSMLLFLAVECLAASLCWRLSLWCVATHVVPVCYTTAVNVDLAYDNACCGIREQTD